MEIAYFGGSGMAELIDKNQNMLENARCFCSSTRKNIEETAYLVKFLENNMFGSYFYS